MPTGTANLTLESCSTERETMPIFVIEREFAEAIEVSQEMVDGIERVNDETTIRWIYSFLSADKKKSYCVYEAESAELIVTAAERAGLPADVVVQVDEVRRPEALPA
jgi:hypothetical protein